MDAVGNEMLYAYDPASHQIREQHFGLDGGPSPLDSSGAGNVLLAETEMRYDELSREFQRDDLLFANVATVGPEGPLTPGDGRVTTRHEYDRLSRRVRVLDDNVHERLFAYDGADRLILETDELQNQAGKPTSSFFGRQSGERLTRIAHERGRAVPARPNVREYDFAFSVGTGPRGGAQTRVRVHRCPTTGQIHGHPAGPERF